METKICTKCGRQLPITDFYWRDKVAGRRRSECKDCHNGYVKQKYAKRREYVENIKAQLKCAKCGESRSYTLDFHHINPEEKDNTVSRMVSHSANEEKLKEEISKCICLCSNCHREFHYFNSKDSNFLIENYINNGPYPNGEGTRL